MRALKTNEDLRTSHHCDAASLLDEVHASYLAHRKTFGHNRRCQESTQCPAARGSDDKGGKVNLEDAMVGKSFAIERVLDEKLQASRTLLYNIGQHGTTHGGQRKCYHHAVSRRRIPYPLLLSECGGPSPRAAKDHVR